MTNSSEQHGQELRASDGGPVGTFNAVSNVFGIASDGADLWALNSRANSVSRF